MKLFKQNSFTTNVSNFSLKALTQGRQFGNMTLAASLAALVLSTGGVSLRPTAAKADSNSGAIAHGMDHVTES